MINRSKRKEWEKLSRRGFILRSASIVVGADLGFYKKLSISNTADCYSDDVAVELAIIDTHTHFYDPTRAIPNGRDRPLPWPGPNESFLYKPTYPMEWEALAKPLGMKGTVVVEAGTNWLEDNDWILQLAERHSSIVGFIGNLTGTAIEKGVIVPVWDNMTRFKQEVRRLARNPIFRGIRVRGQHISKDLSGSRYPHFEILADSGLAIDIGGANSQDILALAKAIPSLTMVVNLGFSPKVSSSEKWRSDIAALGGIQNIVMKVTGLVEGLDSPQTDSVNALVQCSGALDHVCQMFGTDRLVFGTNWPVSQKKAEMSVVTDIVRKYFESKGKDALVKVFAMNAKNVYQYVNRKV